MSLSVSFYRDVVGLPLRYETPEWSEFATEGATFALHAAKAPASGGGAGKAPGQCQPGFSTPDLAAFHRRMIEAGVPCARSPRDEFGVAIAQHKGPDGLEFSVSETRHGHSRPDSE
jgi:catechol 2,3-dioxygenase-like lactoylglutathione lyase family enzyme